MRDLEAVTGRTFPPIVIPARTDLVMVDISVGGVLTLLPDGRRLWVTREVCCEHAYMPRRRPAAPPKNVPPVHDPEGGT